jgi:hypothetical protein
MQLQIIFCTTFYTTLHPAVVVEVTTATIPKTQLQPPTVHQWIRFAIHASQQIHFSYSVLSLKLPPPGTTGTYYRNLEDTGQSRRQSDEDERMPTFLCSSSS